MSRLLNKALLLPVEHRKTIVVGKSGTSGIVNYLTASNGNVLSMGVPEEWAEYIVDKLNANEIYGEKTSQNEPLLYSITIPKECPGEWRGQEFEIDGYGNIKKKFQYRFGMLLKQTKSHMKEWLKFKSDKVKFPYYGHVHCIALFYITEGNGGTLPRFCAVIEKLLIELRVLIRSTQDPCIQSFDGSRIYVVPDGEQRIEITLREYKEGS